MLVSNSGDVGYKLQYWEENEGSFGGPSLLLHLHHFKCALRFSSICLDTSVLHPPTSRLPAVGLGHNPAVNRLRLVNAPSSSLKALLQLRRLGITVGCRAPAPFRHSKLIPVPQSLTGVSIDESSNQIDHLGAKHSQTTVSSTCHPRGVTTRSDA